MTSKTQTGKASGSKQPPPAQGFFGTGLTRSAQTQQTRKLEAEARKEDEDFAMDDFVTTRFSKWQQRTVKTHLVNSRGARNKFISDALARAKPFERIEVAGGEYHESVSITFPIEIVAAEGEGPHIAFRGPSIQCATNCEATICGLTLTCKSKSKTDFAVVLVNGAVRFEDCAISNVHVTSEARPIFEDCEISRPANGIGVRVTEKGGGVFQSCRIHSCSDVCISTDTIGDPLFDRNTIYQDSPLMAISCVGVMTSATAMQAGFGTKSTATFKRNTIYCNGASVTSGMQRLLSGAGGTSLPLQQGYTAHHTSSTVGEDRGMTATNGETACVYVAFGARPTFSQNLISKGEIGFFFESGGIPQLAGNTIQSQTKCGIRVQLGSTQGTGDASNTPSDELDMFRYGGSGGAALEIRENNLIDRCDVGIDVVGWVPGGMPFTSLTATASTPFSVDAVAEQFQKLRGAFFDALGQSAPTMIGEKSKTAPANASSSSALHDPEPTELHHRASKMTELLRASAANPNSALETYLRSTESLFGINIRETKFINCHSNAIRYRDCAFGHVSQCSIESSGSAGILIETGSFPTIMRCEFIDNHGSAISVMTGADPTIVANQITKQKETGISISKHARGLIVENALLQNQGIAIVISDSSSPVVSRNAIQGNFSGGVLISSGARPLLERNSFIHNEKFSIKICSHAAPTIEKNDIVSGGQNGIECTDIAAGVIRRNFIVDNRSHGVVIELDADPVIEQNVIANNHENGVLVRDNGLGTIVGNKIKQNSGFNVRIVEGADPVVRNNDIDEGFGGGLAVTDEGCGLIEKNSFSGNGVVISSKHSNPIVAKNRIKKAVPVAVLCRNECSGTVTHNIITDSAEAAVVLETAANTFVIENRIRSERVGVLVCREGRGVIESNHISDCRLSGIMICTDGAPEVSKNLLERNHRGITLGLRSRGTVENNELTRNDFGFYAVDETEDSLSSEFLPPAMKKLLESTASRASAPTSAESQTPGKGKQKQPLQQRRPSIKKQALPTTARAEVHHNSIFRNKISGILLDSGASGLFKENHIFANARWGIVAHTRAHILLPYDDQLDDNSATPTKTNDASVSDDPTNSALSPPVATRNRFEDATLRIRATVGGGTASFVENVIENHFDANVIFMDHCGANEFNFEKNQIGDSLVGVAIEGASFLHCAKHNDIARCVIGVRTSQTGSGTFTFNHIHDNSFANIHTADSSFPTFVENNVEQSSFYGILIDGAARPGFTNNSIKGNMVAGVALAQATAMAKAAPVARFISNTIAENDRFGVLLLPAPLVIPPSALHPGAKTSSAAVNSSYGIDIDSGKSSFFADNAITRNGYAGIFVSTVFATSDLYEATSPSREQSSHQAPFANDGSPPHDGLLRPAILPPSLRSPSLGATAHSLPTSPETKRPELTSAVASSTATSGPYPHPVVFTRNAVSQNRIGVIIESYADPKFIKNTIASNCFFGTVIRPKARPLVNGDIIENNGFVGLFCSQLSKPVVMDCHIRDNNLQVDHASKSFSISLHAMRPIVPLVRSVVGDDNKKLQRRPSCSGTPPPKGAAAAPKQTIDANNSSNTSSAATVQLDASILSAALAQPPSDALTLKHRTNTEKSTASSTIAQCLNQLIATQNEQTRRCVQWYRRIAGLAANTSQFFSSKHALVLGLPSALDRRLHALEERNLVLSAQLGATQTQRLAPPPPPRAPDDLVVMVDLSEADREEALLIRGQFISTRNAASLTAQTNLVQGVGVWLEQGSEATVRSNHISSQDLAGILFSTVALLNPFRDLATSSTNPQYLFGGMLAASTTVNAGGFSHILSNTIVDNNRDGIRIISVASLTPELLKKQFSGDVIGDTMEWSGHTAPPAAQSIHSAAAKNNKTSTSTKPLRSSSLTNDKKGSQPSNRRGTKTKSAIPPPPPAQRQNSMGEESGGGRSRASSSEGSPMRRHSSGPLAESAPGPSGARTSRRESDSELHSDSHAKSAIDPSDVLQGPRIRRKSSMAQVATDVAAHQDATKLKHRARSVGSDAVLTTSGSKLLREHSSAILSGSGSLSAQTFSGAFPGPEERRSLSVQDLIRPIVSQRPPQLKLLLVEQNLIERNARHGILIEQLVDGLEEIAVLKAFSQRLDPLSSGDCDGGLMGNCLSTSGSNYSSGSNNDLTSVASTSSSVASGRFVPKASQLVLPPVIRTNHFRYNQDTAVCIRLRSVLSFGNAPTIVGADAAAPRPSKLSTTQRMSPASFVGVATPPPAHTLRKELGARSDDHGESGALAAGTVAYGNDSAEDDDYEMFRSGSTAAFSGEEAALVAGLTNRTKLLTMTTSPLKEGGRTLIVPATAKDDLYKHLYLADTWYFAPVLDSNVFERSGTGVSVEAGANGLLSKNSFTEHGQMAVRVLGEATNAYIGDGNTFTKNMIAIFTNETRSTRIVKNEFTANEFAAILSVHGATPVIVKNVFSEQRAETPRQALHSIMQRSRRRDSDARHTPPQLLQSASPIDNTSRSSTPPSPPPELSSLTYLESELSILTGGSDPGAIILNGSDATVVANTLTSNHVGLRARAAAAPRVSMNRFTENDIAAVFEGGSEGYVDNNAFLQSHSCGIVVSSDSTSPCIRCNVFERIGGPALKILRRGEPHVEGNSIRENAIGIFLDDAGAACSIARNIVTTSRICGIMVVDSVQHVQRQAEFERQEKAEAEELATQGFISPRERATHLDIASPRTDREQNDTTTSSAVASREGVVIVEPTLVVPAVNESPSRFVPDPSAIPAQVNTLILPKIVENLFEENHNHEDVRIRDCGEAHLKGNTFLGAVVSSDFGLGFVESNAFVGKIDRAIIIEANGSTIFQSNCVKDAKVGIFGLKGGAGCCRQNTLMNSCRIAIEAELHNMTIFQDNSITDVTDCGIKASGGLFLGNDISRCPVGCVVPEKGHPTMRDNQIYACTGEGMVLGGGGTFTKNTIGSCRVNLRVVSQISTATVAENYIMDADTCGVVLSEGCRCTFSNNDVFDNGISGVVVEAHARCTIDGNSLSSRLDQGALEVASEAKCQLHHNLVRNQFSPAFRKGLTSQRQKELRRFLDAVVTKVQQNENAITEATNNSRHLYDRVMTTRATVLQLATSPPARGVPRVSDAPRASISSTSSGQSLGTNASSVPTGAHVIYDDSSSTSVSATSNSMLVMPRSKLANDDANNNSTKPPIPAPTAKRTVAAAKASRKTRSQSAVVLSPLSGKGYPNAQTPDVCSGTKLDFGDDDADPLQRSHSTLVRSAIAQLKDNASATAEHSTNNVSTSLQVKKAAAKVATVPILRVLVHRVCGKGGLTVGRDFASQLQAAAAQTNWLTVVTTTAKDPVSSVLRTSSCDVVMVVFPPLLTGDKIPDDEALQLHSIVTFMTGKIAEAPQGIVASFSSTPHQQAMTKANAANTNCLTSVCIVPRMAVPDGEAPPLVAPYVQQLGHACLVDDMSMAFVNDVVAVLKKYHPSAARGWEPRLALMEARGLQKVFPMLRKVEETLEK